MTQSVLNQIRTAPLYTKDLLSHVDQKDWFRQPTEGVTHIAWQVGHLAVAQYNLSLKRVRGEKPEDADLIPADFRRLFGKGSVPMPKIIPHRKKFWQSSTGSMTKFSRKWEPCRKKPFRNPPLILPIPCSKRSWGAMLWSAQHEFIHAGQIALLRRLFGEESLR